MINPMTTRPGGRVQTNVDLTLGDGTRVPAGTLGTVTTYHGSGTLSGPRATVTLDMPDSKWGGRVSATFAFHTLEPAADAAPLVTWGRSESGHVDSRGGRFSISPVYRGRETPSGYHVRDHASGQVCERETQRAAKEQADIWAAAFASLYPTDSAPSNRER
jgi:hypothetical protein